MTGGRTPLTVDEHRALGLELASTGDTLAGICAWLADGRLPHDHRVVRALEMAQAGLDEARSALDLVLFEDRHAGAGPYTPAAYYPDAQARAGWRARRAV